MELAKTEVQAVENVVAEQTDAAYLLLSDLNLSCIGGGVGDVSLG